MYRMGRFQLEKMILQIKIQIIKYLTSTLIRTQKFIFGQCGVYNTGDDLPETALIY